MLKLRSYQLFAKVVKVWIAQRPPGFGFVLMSCRSEAEDAVRCLHGTKMCGNRCVRGRGLKSHRQVYHGVLQGHGRNDKQWKREE